MIMNILFSFFDGISYLFPFMFINDHDEFKQYLYAGILLILYTALNCYISVINPMSELLRELLLSLLTFGLIIAYNKKINLVYISVFLVMLMINDILVLCVFSTFNNYLSNPITSLIVQVLRFAVFFIAAKYCKKKISFYSTENMHGFFLILIPMFILFEVLYQRYLITQNTYMLIELLAAILSFLGIILLIRKYYLINGELERQRMTLNILDLSRKSLQEINQKQVETRKIRHDMSARLVTIQGLLKNGKEQEAIQYIDDSLDIVKSIEIKNYCSIDAVNVLINYKKALYQDIDLCIDSSCSANPGIDVMDISIIVSNLIDNAAREINEHHLERKITLKIKQNNAMLLIGCSNELSHKKDLRSDRINIKDHGMGLMIIQEIVNKYDGTMSIEQTHQFSVRMLLNGNETS